MKRWVETDVNLVRSYEDETTWVPVMPGGDSTCFLHAGPIRKVKAYAEDVIGEDVTWRRDTHDGAWTAFVRSGSAWEAQP